MTHTVIREGHSMDVVTLPVRVMRLLGVKLLIVTNAAGGLNPNYNVGDIAIINDHLGMPIISGHSPLMGENDDLMGPRFPAMSDAYNATLSDMIQECAKELNLSHVVRPRATYCFVAGPAYESIAESKFLRSVGGDTVGMSTIPEVIVAKHCGMAIVGLSLVTNKVVTSLEEANHASHEEVLESVKMSGKNVESIVRRFVSKDSLRAFLSAITLPEIDLSKKKLLHHKKAIELEPLTVLFGSCTVAALTALSLLFIYRKK
jgi:purine-nucleoside phosphorylase